MEQVNISKRITHKYRPAWSYLDFWEQLGTVKLTPPKQVQEGNGYDDLGVYIQHTRLPTGMNWREAARALTQTLSGSGCRHEYDCCGCRSTYVSVKRIGHRRLCIITRMTANY